MTGNTVTFIHITKHILLVLTVYRQEVKLKSQVLLCLSMVVHYSSLVAMCDVTHSSLEQVVFVFMYQLLRISCFNLFHSLIEPRLSIVQKSKQRLQKKRKHMLSGLRLKFH